MTDRTHTSAGFWRTIQCHASTTGPLQQAEGRSAGRSLVGVLGPLGDPAQEKPCALSDIAAESITENGQKLIVMRSPQGNYLRLTPEQADVWRQMDGTRTVAQLATQAFLASGRLLPVGELAATLRQEGFLTERPVGVYRAIGARLAETTAEGRGRQVLRLMRGESWRFRHIDAFYAALYRAGGWLLFTRVFVVIWALLVLAGLVAFAVLFQRGGQFGPTGAASLPRDIAQFALALLVAFIIHESAHALAVKHYRRRVLSGGIMLYYGIPALFVDTSDIWRSRRRARLIVSAAGPMADATVGSVAALVAVALPAGPLHETCVKLALTCGISSIANLNPLLELDGYYMLVDWLRLPDLRRRALAFLRGPFWAKWRQRAPFSHEERIFGLYGILTTAATVVAVVFALNFWQRHIGAALRALWQSDSLLGQIVAVGVALAVGGPLLLGAALLAVGTARSGIGWLARHGYARRTAVVAPLALFVAGALTLLAARVPLIAAWFPPLLWGAALVAMQPLLAWYRRSALAPALAAIAGMMALSALAGLLRVALHADVLAQVLDAIGVALVFVVGLAALRDVQLRHTRFAEACGAAALAVAAFIPAGLLLVQLQERGLAVLPAILISLPAYLALLALAGLLPLLFELAGSRMAWAWWLAGLALLVRPLDYVADVLERVLWLDTLTASLWLAAALLHLLALRPDGTDLRHETASATDEADRLRQAFTRWYAGCFVQMRAVYGARRARAFDDQMDVLAATANWDVTLDGEVVRIGAEAQSLPLVAQGSRYAEVMRYAADQIGALCGAAFASRAAQMAYDALPWAERETLVRLALPDAEWAQSLSQAFGGAHAARLLLIRQIDDFAHCSDEELLALAAAFEPVSVRAGDVVLAEGTPAPGIWVVEAGEVQARTGTDRRELHRGAVLGNGDTAPAPATYRASIDSTLLFLAAETLRLLVSSVAPHAAERSAAAEDVALLERTPLFASLPRASLAQLAQAATRRTHPARAVIRRAGSAGNEVAVILSGRVVALLPRPGERPLHGGQYGPGEFFGEHELFSSEPFPTHLVALEPLTVLCVPHALLRSVALGHHAFERGITQIGTARIGYGV